MVDHLTKQGQKQARKILDMAQSDDNEQMLHNWLVGLFDGTFQTYLKIYQLRTPEVWKNYELMGIKDLHEQRLLTDTLADFRKEWSDSYPYRKQDDVQPEATQGIASGMSHHRVIANLPPT